MNILNIDCRDIINLLQETLHLQHVNVIYDSMETIRTRLEGGAHTIFLNVIDDEAECEKYEKKAEVARDKYKTKSPAIHFPDLKVWRFIEVFKADVTGAYERTCHYLDSVMMKAECPIELKFVMNAFLHEVGHWNQLMGKNRHVKQYIEIDLNLEKKNADDSFELYKKIHGIRDIQGTDRPHIPKGLMNKLIELEEEYRQIPKEADADKYAREILSDLDIDAFIKNLKIIISEQT